MTGRGSYYKDKCSREEREQGVMASIIGSIGGSQEDVRPIKRALLSVSDKSGLVELGQKLHSYGVELLSTGARRRPCAGRGSP